jgi:hypothetical protein
LNIAWKTPADHPRRSVESLGEATKNRVASSFNATEAVEWLMEKTVSLRTAHRRFDGLPSPADDKFCANLKYGPDSFQKRALAASFSANRTCLTRRPTSRTRKSRRLQIWTQKISACKRPWPCRACGLPNCRTSGKARDGLPDGGCSRPSMCEARRVARISLPTRAGSPYLWTLRHKARLERLFATAVRPRRRGRGLS